MNFCSSPATTRSLEAAPLKTLGESQATMGTSATPTTTQEMRGRPTLRSPHAPTPMPATRRNLTAPAAQAQTSLAMVEASPLNMTSPTRRAQAQQPQRKMEGNVG